MSSKERKDYMGLISWNRSLCGAPHPMFGSEIKTDSPICIRICKAYISELSDATHQRISGVHPAMIEIEMTPVQWAEFLTAGTVDDGVPCTITKIDGKPTERVQERRIVAEYDDHISAKFHNFQEGIKCAEQKIKDVLDSGKTMSKTQMRELLQMLEVHRNNSVENLDYAMDRFKEDMAKIVVNAKSEVNAYATLRLGADGTRCLINDADEKPAEIGGDNA